MEGGRKKRKERGRDRENKGGWGGGRKERRDLIYKKKGVCANNKKA